jgi:hypothetical protein
VNLTIKLPDEDLPTLKAKATARGVSAEQYALDVPEQDLAPEWLRKSWASAREAGLDQLSMDDIDAEIAAARRAGREGKPQPGAWSGLFSTRTSSFPRCCNPSGLRPRYSSWLSAARFHSVSAGMCMPNTRTLYDGHAFAAMKA